jgi:hypothetical protein
MCLTDINVIYHTSVKYTELMCIKNVLLFAISCHDLYDLIFKSGLNIRYVLSHITFQYIFSKTYFSYQYQLPFVFFQ